MEKLTTTQANTLIARLIANGAATTENGELAFPNIIENAAKPGDTTTDEIQITETVWFQRTRSTPDPDCMSRMPEGADDETRRGYERRAAGTETPIYFLTGPIRDTID